MKKRILISKIIGIVGLLIFAIGISYIVTFYLDKKNFQDIDLLVTFEDSKTFTLENTNHLTKEKVLETYPYKFKIENKGFKTEYKIIIEDIESKNINRVDLNYLLYKDDKEIKNGNLNDIKNNILLTDTIGKKKSINYSLYIYTDKDIEDITYEYSLKIESNK